MLLVFSDQGDSFLGSGLWLIGEGGELSTGFWGVFPEGFPAMRLSDDPGNSVVDLGQFFGTPFGLFLLEGGDHGEVNPAFDRAMDLGAVEAGHV